MAQAKLLPSGYLVYLFRFFFFNLFFKLCFSSTHLFKLLFMEAVVQTPHILPQRNILELHLRKQTSKQTNNKKTTQRTYLNKTILYMLTSYQMWVYIGVYTPQSWYSSRPDRQKIDSKVSQLFLLSLCTGYCQVENSRKKMKQTILILSWSQYACATVTMNLGSTLIVMLRSSCNLFLTKLLNFVPCGNLIGHVCSMIVPCLTHSGIK